MYTYWQIFKQAFRIVLKTPGLWLFGLLTVFLGSAGGLELVLSNYGFGGEGIMFSFISGLIDGGLFTAGGGQGFIKIMFSHPLYLFVIVLIFLVILALSILILWLGTISQTVLIGETINISEGKKPNWRSAFRLGIHKFWPVLGLNVLLRAASWLLIFILGSMAIVKLPGLIFILVLAPVILFAAILLVSFVGKYAICGVVLHQWRFIGSIKSGWQTFIKNWLATLEITILLFCIFLLANLLLTFFFIILLAFALKMFAAFLFALVLLFIISAALFIAIQVLLVMFNWAVWAIVFELMAGKRKVLVSFLGRVFRK
jgi:hypothetical protein